MFHIFNYLLTYCNENFDLSDEVKDLTNEVRNFILAYFAYWLFCAEIKGKSRYARPRRTNVGAKAFRFAL